MWYAYADFYGGGGKSTLTLPCDGGMGRYGVLNFPKMWRKFHGLYEITHPEVCVDVVAYMC